MSQHLVAASELTGRCAQGALKCSEGTCGSTEWIRDVQPSHSSLVWKLTVCRRLTHIHPLLPLEGITTQKQKCRFWLLPPFLWSSSAFFISLLISKVRYWHEIHKMPSPEQNKIRFTSFSDGNDAEENERRKNVSCRIKRHFSGGLFHCFFLSGHSILIYVAFTLQLEW